MNRWIDEFFDEDLQLESYCSKVNNKDKQLLALKLAVETAAVDGLDIKENLALQKVMNFWNINFEEAINA